MPLRRLRLPVFGAPMFLVSGPALVIAQCKAGVVGSFPGLNARPAAQLDEWLHEITETLAAYDRDNPHAPAAPFAVNQIVQRSNDRLDHDLALCAKWKVPIVITSLGGREEVNRAVHDYGGLTFHDVTSDRLAHKAIERGADGLIAVTAGAGGATGSLSPFALVQDIRSWFDGPLALAGAIASGRGILAARTMGADFAYVGSAFIATTEANAHPTYKQMVVDAAADSVTVTRLFTGLPASFLRSSITRAGLDPDQLPDVKPTLIDFSTSAQNEAKTWRDIWGCGQGVGSIREILPCAQLVARLKEEYRAAVEEMRARESAPDGL